MLDIIKDASGTTDSIDKAVDLLTFATQTACRTTLKILSHEKVSNNNHRNNNKNLPWVNNETMLIRYNIRLIKRRLLRSSRKHQIDLASALQNLKNQYTSAINKSKSSSWKEYCGRQGKETIWSNVYRIIKHKFSTDILIAKDKHGNALKQEEVLDDIKSRFYPSDNPAEDSLYHHRIRMNASYLGASRNRQTEPKISVKEVEHAFKSMNPKKAPGRDHLTADICYQCFKSSPALFYEIFNKCLE